MRPQTDRERIFLMTYVKCAIYFLLALMVICGYALADKKPTPTPAPRPQQAIVTPQGGINFGESAVASPAARHKATKRWAEMTQKEIDVLTGLLKTLGKQPPVMIVCK